MRFAENTRQPVSELMTRENLVTVRDRRRARTRPSACSTSIASRRLLVVDDDHRCVGLVTVKDIEKAEDPSRMPARTRRAA